MVRSCVRGSVMTRCRARGGVCVARAVERGATCKGGRVGSRPAVSTRTTTATTIHTNASHTCTAHERVTASAGQRVHGKKTTRDGGEGRRVRRRGGTRGHGGQGQGTASQSLTAIDRERLTFLSVFPRKKGSTAALRILFRKWFVGCAHPSLPPRTRACTFVLTKSCTPPTHAHTQGASQSTPPPTQNPHVPRIEVGEAEEGGSSQLARRCSIGAFSFSFHVDSVFILHLPPPRTTPLLVAGVTEGVDGWVGEERGEEHLCRGLLGRAATTGNGVSKRGERGGVRERLAQEPRRAHTRTHTHT